MNTLIIILSEIENNELIFNNIKKELIDEVNGDLCLCMDINKNYNNKFYKLAKYTFLYNK